MADDERWAEPGAVPTSGPAEVPAASDPAAPDPAAPDPAAPDQQVAAVWASPVYAPVAASAPAAFYPGPPRPLDVRAWVAIGCLVLTMVESLASLAHDLQVVPLMNDIESGDVGDDVLARADTWDTVDGVLGVVELVLLAVTAVAFVLWLWRARSNLDAYGWTRQRRSKGWVIGSWFVPVVSFWFPFMVVVDVWRASHPARNPAQQDLARLSTGRLLSWWWGLWIAGNVLSWALLRSPAPTTPDETSSREVFWAINEGLWVVAAVLAILVIRQISRFQSIRAQAVAPWAVDPADLPRLPSLARS